MAGDHLFHFSGILNHWSNTSIKISLKKQQNESEL